MSIRGLIRGQVILSPALTSAIPAERWFGSGSVEQDCPRPFAEMRFGTSTLGMGPVRRRNLDIYIHDVDGDYDGIDSILSALRSVLDGLEQVDFDGAELLRSEWTGDSVDLFDDGYKTIYRSTSYRLVGRG